jgi:sulfoxide reductase heme-binding subunit YedZ
METFEWYMIRATGNVAYLMLYLSVMIGLYTQVQKMRKQKMTISLHLHEVLSNWALYLTGGHIVFLLIDAYFKFNWKEVLVPFATDYKPLPMALGVLATYFLIMVIVTSRARKKIGYQRWRKLHALNPILYGMVTLHGLLIGSDFPGVVITAINIVPFLIFGVMLLKDRKKAPLMDIK